MVPSRLPGITLQNLQTTLQGKLPGAAAQARMGIAPELQRVNPPHSGRPRQSAVLVLIYPQDGQLAFPLTLRADGVANHKGQISLPGGQIETGDASLWETALRETYEEIGVPSKLVTYVGALSSHHIVSSHFIVNPFVGWSDSSLTFAPNAEVAEVIRMPLAMLMDPSAKGSVIRTLESQDISVPCYRYGDYCIWGATAMVLSEFEAVLTRITE